MNAVMDKRKCYDDAVVHICIYIFLMYLLILHNSTNCDDCFHLFCLPLLLWAFYGRLDTVISRNGMNKVFCV